jgi:hypothetical protein
LATPYAPSQLVLNNFDASQSATASWAFSSPDPTVIQQSFRIQIYNNATGTLVLDTGTVYTTNPYWVIPTNTLVNRTQYKWRVMYTDSNGNASPWSQYQVFTCSSLPQVTLTNPTASQTLASNVVTLSCSYSQAQGVAQQSYRFILYASDQRTIVQDSGTINGTANQFTINPVTNGNYYAQAIVTSADGLQNATGLIPFTISYSGPSQSPSITLTPLPNQASIRLDFLNSKSIPGTYIGSGATYKAGKFGQALQIAAYGEKVYWTVAAFTQFTYTDWLIANLASSAMTNNQVFVHIRADANNFLQIRYDHINQAFVFEKYINGSGIVARSPSGITFAAGAQIFVSIKQTSTAAFAYIGVGGNFYTISFPADTTDNTNTLGVMTYGVGTFASSVTGVVQNLKTVYLGCSPADGNEANVLIDQAHLTSLVMQDSDIQNLYTNATVQQFGFQSMFLANFDGNLEGGNAGAYPVAYWNIYRTYNGIQKLLGTVQNTNQPTMSFIDTTPLSGTNYQYSIVPVDTQGNIGTGQVIFGSVQFSGWWLTDISSGTSFQLYLQVEDVPIKTNYTRGEYKTFGTYPIPAYAPTRYRSGKLAGWIVGVNQPLTPYQQYQVLQALIDSHRPLLLRGDEGWGMMVDCFDPQNTIPQRNHQQWNKVEFNWVEVASA